MATPAPAQSAVVRQMRALYTALDRFEQAVADQLELPRSDLRCVAMLEGPMTPSEIGRALGLSSGAVTALLDRLEARGLVERRPSETDRRSVAVHLAPAQYRRIGGLYLKMATEVAAAFAGESAEGREAAVRVLSRATEACERATAKVLDAKILDARSEAAPSRARAKRQG